MIALYIYIGFSYLFMLGSAIADSKDGKESKLSYFIGVSFAPIIFPFALGYSLTIGGK